MSNIEKFIAIHQKTDNKPIFNFGKYKGLSYDEVFEKDKSYVAWLLKSDSKYYIKAQEYFKNLINQGEELV